MSVNLSKAKREAARETLEALRAFLSGLPQDAEAQRLLAGLTALESEFLGKKYGLVFEEHMEETDELLRGATPVLAEEPALFLDRGGPMNFLLEGDNLGALTLLQRTHQKRVDAIFIDPPYNRGSNDFLYDDAFVGPADSFRHSKYLSFMQKRLVLAKKLLAASGCLFINIDDHEFAQLKVLCDEIFGEENFISCFPWHNRTSVQNDTDISINHEYLLAYAKNRRQVNRRLKPSNQAEWHSLRDFVFQPKKTDPAKYSNPDGDPRGLWKADPFDAPGVRENLTYEIQNPNTGESYLPPKGRHWRTERQKFEALLADGRIVFGKTGKGRPQQKIFYEETCGKGEIATSWFDADVFGTSTRGKKELLALLPALPAGKIFETPKPVQLYVELLKLVIPPQRKTGVVLDFFAGSGTVGQAVMEYNRISGNSLSFLLCNNNQNDICRSITYERLRRAIEEGDFPASLKYFRVEYVPTAGRLYYEYAEELLRHVRALVELENGAESCRTAVLLDDADLAAFFASPERLAACRAVYLGDDALPDAAQQAALRERGVAVRPISEYYYQDLQEEDAWN